MGNVSKRTSRIAILGSSGILSQSFRNELQSRSSKFVLYGRNKKSDIFFDINNESSWPLKVHADVIVVFAWDANNRNGARSDINVKFAKHILDISRETKSRPIFISTTSAHRNSLSYYGKSKFIAEKYYADANAQILKLAFVDDKFDTETQNFTYKTLSFLRNLPVTLNIDEMPLIPTTVLDSVNKNLFHLIDNPDKKLLICKDKHKNISDFFSNYNNGLQIKMNLRNIDKVVSFLQVSRLLPRSVTDRWLSLRDSSLFDQNYSIES